MKIIYILEITKVKRAKSIVGMETIWALSQTQASYTRLHLPFLGKNVPCHSANTLKKKNRSKWSKESLEVELGVLQQTHRGLQMMREALLSSS